GRHVLTGSHDATLRLWDTATGQEIRRFEGHTDMVQCVALSPDGRFALSGSNDHTVRLWDVKSGRELHRFDGHRDCVQSVAFAPDGRNALSAGGGQFDKKKWLPGDDFALRLWDLPPDKAPQATIPEPPTKPVVGPLVIETEPLPKQAPGPPLNNLAMVSRPAPLAGVLSWTVETMAHRSAVEAIAYDPGGKRLATADRDGVVRIWEPKTGRLLRMIVVPAAWLTGIAWSPDGEVLATASE